MSYRETSDSSPAAIAVRSEIYRQMTSRQKAQCIRDLCNSANRLALIGLRQRHPSANEGEVMLRLAVLRLGEELVFRAYGWRQPDGA
jgi:hypothetical protein